jgi:hypothetical protein
MLRARQRAGLRTTYFIDDFLLYMNDWLPPKLMRMCDQVITLGYELKPYLEDKFGLDNVVQMKTHVNVDQFKQVQPGLLKPGTFNLVWFSMASTGQGFLKLLFDKIDKLNDFKDVVFWCVCPNAALNRAEFYQYRNVNCRYSEFLVPDGLIKLEKSADVIINPIHTPTDNATFVPGVDRAMFMNAKSEVKYTHAGGAKKPLITCRSSPYEVVIDNGVNGFISDEVDGWIEYILALKNDKDMAERMGKAAWDDITINYNCMDRFQELMERIIGEQDDSSDYPDEGPVLDGGNYSLGAGAAI